MNPGSSMLPAIFSDSSSTRTSLAGSISDCTDVLPAPDFDGVPLLAPFGLPPPFGLNGDGPAIGMSNAVTDEAGAGNSISNGTSPDRPVASNRDNGIVASCSVIAPQLPGHRSIVS